MLFGMTMKNWWRIFVPIALTGIILSYIDVYALGDTHRDTLWKEELILPFYFTLISNGFALAIATIKGFTNWSGKKWAKGIEVFGFVNLLITFVVYWTLLFPVGIPKHGVAWATNMAVHLVTPAMMIWLFLVQNIKLSERRQFNIWVATSKHFIFVIGYLVFALTIYYSLGGHKEDAIYAFLAFGQNARYMSLAISAGISLGYFWLTFLAYFIINKYSK